MAKKKAARSAKGAVRKAGSSAKKAARKASASARRPAAARKAKKAKKAAKARPVARKSAKAKARPRPAVKAAKKAARSRKKVARKPAATPAPRAAKTAPKAAKPVVKAAPPLKAAAPKSAARPAKKPNLDRPRRTVAEIHGVPSSLDLERPASAVRTGRAEMEQKLQQHTNTSPALTAGDVDADWSAAESSGDEAPGGDNPTPDQDVVDEIGRALGVEYDDDQELQGGDEIAARDRHRWELDPGSSDDFEER